MQEEVPIANLDCHPENPREGDVGAIVESIRSNGWFGTIVAQKSTGYVLAGNHRLIAAGYLGMETVPVFWADVDDKTARRILLADNRTAELATYNVDELASLLEAAAKENNLEGTGYEGEDIDMILRQAQTPPMDFLEAPSSIRINECPACNYKWEIRYGSTQ